MNTSNATCRRGHPRTPETTYQYPRKDGSVRLMCKMCNSLRDKNDPNSSTVLNPLKRGRRRTRLIRPTAARYKKDCLWRIDGEVAYILLSGGREAIVDMDQLQNVTEGYRWCAVGAGYVTTTTRPRITLHRLIMNAPAGMDVDHINHNTLDCRRSNLRITSRSQNLQNQRITGRKNGSGQKNVAWNRSWNKWVVSLMCQGKIYYGGGFDDFDAAVAKASDLRRAIHTHCPENSLPQNG